MKSFFRKSLQRVLTGAVLALPAIALAAGMELRNEAFQDVVVKGKDGKSQQQRQPVSRAVPGAEIIYVLTYRNSGDKPAEKVVLHNPVPAGLAFVPGSAGGAGSRAEVSVDGGTTYGALETLRVKDAKGLRAAKAADVTHVRWTLPASVPAGKEGAVTYRAVVK